MSAFVQTLMEKDGFLEFRPEDRDWVQPYQDGTSIFDDTFTNYWCWGLSFQYVYRIIGDTLAVVYEGLEKTAYCNLLPGPSGELKYAITVMRDIFRREGLTPVFDYVPEDWLPLYREAGFPLEATWDRDLDDYIFRTSDFVNLEGSENKSKRRELHLAAKQGELSHVLLNQETFEDACTVFDDWCSWHKCEDCYYGCERDAFHRIREVWTPRYYGIVAYLEGKPIGFSVTETLKGIACYIFQKNSINFRGMTFYLSYHSCFVPGHPEWFNWGEDMGLPGMRLNKSRYRPTYMLHKYQVVLTG